MAVSGAHRTAAGTTEAELVLEGLRKTYGGIVAVDRCDLAMRRGEIVALLGPSGCGKSTLLNMIAGFETPDHGTVRLGGRIINAIPPHKRNVAMVFQHYAMFPHLTVADNIAYGLHARRLAKADIRARTREMMSLLQLHGLDARFPAQLSGGQRQRVAVARALAVRPDMLLLDEAFSALDRNLREDMQLELSLLLRRLSVTTVLVTHDQREAFVLADRIAIMDAGRIVQIGTPEDVYRNPGSGSVLRFLGTVNRLTGKVAVASGGKSIVLAPSLAFMAVGDIAHRDGDEVLIDLRAEDLAVSMTPTAVHRGDPASIALRTFLGARERIVVALGAHQLVIDRPAQSGLDQVPLIQGTRVYVDFDPARCRLSEAR
jgi:ABC-type Fe3+/spermidine/putrescine transport system ATPase subunit